MSGHKDNPLSYSIVTRLLEDEYDKLLSPQPGERILDIGCGTGYFLRKLGRTGAEICGIDVSFDSVAVVTQNVRGRVAVASATALPFAESSFDNVLLSQVIEHIEDDAAAIREIARVGKANADVIISTQNLNAIRTKSALKRLCHEDAREGEAHVRDGYTPTELAELMEHNGATVSGIRFTLHLFSELVMEMTKVGYVVASGGKMRSQADVIRASGSPLFKLWTLVFPFLLTIGRLETFLIKMIPWHLRILEGHALIARGKVTE